MDIDRFMHYKTNYVRLATRLEAKKNLAKGKDLI
jgi:hypothetical protein